MATTLADPRLPIVRDQFARSPRLNRLLSPLSAGRRSLRSAALRLPMRWFANMRGIANHPEVSRLLATDPVGGGNRVPLRFMHSLLSITPAIEPEEFDVCPVLLAHPAADRWTTLEASKPFFDRIKAPKEFAMLENCGHFPIEEPGVIAAGASDGRISRQLALRDAARSSGGHQWQIGACELAASPC